MRLYKFNICNPHHNKRIITGDHKTIKSNRLKKIDKGSQQQRTLIYKIFKGFFGNKQDNQFMYLKHDNKKQNRH